MCGSADDLKSHTVCSHPAMPLIFFQNVLYKYTGEQPIVLHSVIV